MAEYLRSEMKGRDMNYICRLCLGVNVQLLNVFESREVPGWSAAHAMNELLRIEISDGDIYPKFICTDCMGKLVDFKLFKHQCEINKDLLDLEYKRNHEVGDNEAVLGTVFCSIDKNTELYAKEEDLEVPIEKDPLELSEGEEDDSIKAEIEESSNGNDEMPSAEVIGSADQIHHPIKCENDDQVSSMDANEISIPHDTSTTEAMRMKEEPHEVYSQCENILCTDHSMKEEVLDIRSESISNRTFEEGISMVSEDELNDGVDSKASLSLEMAGCSTTSCMSPNVLSMRSQNDIRGPTGVSTLSSLEDIFGNDSEVPKSILMSSHYYGVPSSCNVSQTVKSEQEPITVSQCHDEHSIVSKVIDQEKIIVNDKVFACVKCFEKFPTSDLLGKHSVIHSGEDFFQQPGCSKTTRQQSNIKKQMKIYSEEGIFACSECSETFPHKQKLREHLFYSGDIPFVCDRCSLAFYCKNQLIDHVKTHSLDIPIHCTLCSEVFLHEDELKTHMGVHADEKRFKCGQCSKSYTQKGTLKAHLRIHSGVRPFKCHQCSKSFSKRGDLNKHLRIHSGERPYKCYECSESYPRKDHLIVHMRIHTGEKPYRCDQCGASFCTSSSLKTHSRIHSGERPYGCDQCGKTFIRTGDRNRHKMVHSGERPHECKHCSKCFATNGDLNKHTRVHSAVRPYKCDQCSKAFYRSNALKTHMRVHSGGRPHR